MNQNTSTLTKIFRCKKSKHLRLTTSKLRRFYLPYLKINPLHFSQQRSISITNLHLFYQIFPFFFRSSVYEFCLSFLFSTRCNQASQQLKSFMTILSLEQPNLIQACSMINYTISKGYHSLAKRFCSLSKCNTTINNLLKRRFQQGSKFCKMKFIRTVILSLTLLSVGVLFSACGDSSTENTEKTGKEYTSAYVCPMHCEGSGSETAGKCPVCGMDYKKNTAHKADGHKH